MKFCLTILCSLFAWLSAGAHDGHQAAGLAIGAAISPQGELWTVGVDAQGRLATRTSADAGATWSAPRVLAIGDDTVAAEGENHPKLAFGPRSEVVIAYTHPLAKPYTGEVRVLRSSDGGKTFSAPRTVHRDRQLITHRFESIAFDQNGVLHTLWVDKRDQSAAGEKYRGAAIYRNESRDGGASFGPDIKVADHSCECCRIALAAAPGGGVAALWRHVFAPNVRDHAFAILGRGNDAVVRATFDDWQIDACPHHGPGLAVDGAGIYHMVWFGERAGKPAVRYGRLSPQGQALGEVSELPDAHAEHADIAAHGQLIAIVWRSYDAGQTHLRAWVSSDAGKHFAMRELAASDERNDQPRLAADARRILVVWRTASALRVFGLDP